MQAAAAAAAAAAVNNSSVPPTGGAPASNQTGHTSAASLNGTQAGQTGSPSVAPQLPPAHGK